MKLIKALAVTGAMAVAGNAAATDDSYTFRFDNGDGLYGSSVHSTFTSRYGAFLPENGTPVSRYFIHQDLGAGTLHYGGTVSEDEHHYYGGVSYGGTTLAFFQGDGERFSKAPDALYQDLNQYFFHGGTRLPFEFRGIAADVALDEKVSARFAATDVTAPGVEDRHGYYAGVTGRRFSAGISSYDRGGEKVGEGLNLGFSGDKLDLAYQEIRSEYDARVRRVALSWSTTPSSGLSLSFEQASNDRFARDDEQRIMLRFRASLGRSIAFNAAGNGNDAQREPGFNKAIGIGVGLGVGAIALSSGSGGNDSANRFAVRNDAAFKVLNGVNPVSVQQNREHGGWIYQNADNTYGYTAPIAGDVASINLGNPYTSVPMGTQPSASYHTHGGPDPRYDNEHFSPVDIESDRTQRVDGYLGTPAGYMKLHDYETGNISVVGRIAN